MGHGASWSSRHRRRPTQAVSSRCVAAVAAGAPGREWQLATVNGKWRIGFRGEAGPAGAIVVVGELAHLSLHRGHHVRSRAGRLWADRVDAGYGRYVAVGTGTSSVSSGLDVIVRVRASAPVWQMDTVRWVVALGTNDVGRTNAGRADWWCAQQIAAALADPGPPGCRRSGSTCAPDGWARNMSRTCGTRPCRRTGSPRSTGRPRSRPAGAVHQRRSRASHGLGYRPAAATADRLRRESDRAFEILCRASQLCEYAILIVRGMGFSFAPNH